MLIKVLAQDLETGDIHENRVIEFIEPVDGDNLIVHYLDGGSEKVSRKSEWVVERI